MGLFFSEGKNLPRPLKALNLDMQVFSLLVFSAISIVAQLEFHLSVSVAGTFVLMRCVGFVDCLLLKRNGGCCDRFKNAAAFVLFLAAAVLAHLLLFGFLLSAKAVEIDEWTAIVAICLPLDFLVWDFMVKPLCIKVMASKSLRLHTMLMG